MERMDEVMRYRTRETVKRWNKLVKPTCRIHMRDRIEYNALKDELAEAHGRTGNRTLEVPSWAAKSGHAELIDF
jgi:hypothetical protein